MSQFKSLSELLRSNPTEQDCINYLENIIWKGKPPTSPFDPTSKVYKCKDNRYKCKNTGKYFTTKSLTVFRNSKIKLLDWFWTLCYFSNKKGISSCQLERYIGITQKSAWFALHRLRETFKNPIFTNEMLKGSVEIDETFIGGKNKNRHWNKKVPNSQGRSCKDKIPVWGAIEKSGNLIAKAVPNNQQGTLVPMVRNSVKAGSNIYSDELPAYEILNKWFNHEIVNHRIKQYVNGKVSTNTIESAWACLKRVLNTYHQVSKKHLPRYVDEFTFRFNTRKCKEQERFDLVLLSSVGKGLSYRELVVSH